MKEEALKLADELEALHQYVPSEAPAMIRRLVEELDKQGEPYGWVIKSQHQGMIYKEKPKSMATIPLYTTPQAKPLSDEEIINIWLPFATYGIKGKIEFARAIEERHGIK